MSDIHHNYISGSLNFKQLKQMNKVLTENIIILMNIP